MKRLLHAFFYLTIFLLICANVEAASITGIWHNMEHNNRLLKKVIISKQNHHIVMHAWGYCGKTVCDWGTVTLNKPLTHGYVLLKPYDQQTLGIAIFNVFTKYTKQPNKLLEWVMKRQQMTF